MNTITKDDCLHQTPAYKRWQSGDQQYTVSPEIEQAVEFCTADDRQIDAVNWRDDFKRFYDQHARAVQRFNNKHHITYDWDWDDVLPYWDTWYIHQAVEFYQHRNDAEAELIDPVKSFTLGWSNE